MKAQRLDKLEQQRESLERDFRDALVEALRECADGRWGLFERNKGLLPTHLERHLVPDSVTKVNDLAEQVSAVRMTLGYSELPELLHLEALRRVPNAGNAVGEQRQAKTWLKQIENDSNLGLSPEGRGDLTATSQKDR